MLDALQAQLRSASNGNGHASGWVVDASALQVFDSSALAVLLECRREVLHDGRRFAVRGLAPRLRELATLYGIAELLPEPTATPVMADEAAPMTA